MAHTKIITELSQAEIKNGDGQMGLTKVANRPGENVLPLQQKLNV